MLAKTTNYDKMAVDAFSKAMDCWLSARFQNNYFGFLTFR